MSVCICECADTRELYGREGTLSLILFVALTPGPGAFGVVLCVFIGPLTHMNLKEAA